MDSINEIGRTFKQMGSNLVNSPSSFVGKHGLRATKEGLTNTAHKAYSGAASLANDAASLVSGFSIKNPLERELPDVNTRNGDTWGSSIRDSFTLSTPRVKGPKQHASNLQPGESNAFGGRYDFSA